MKPAVRILMIIALCLALAPAALAKGGQRAPRAAASVAGVYGDFTVGQGSGDLEGMRVAIFSAGSGYHAVVQIAQGGAEDPEPVFVQVKVTGMNVEFTVDEQKYTGTVTAAGLDLKGADGSRMLKRQACSSYFGG